MRLYESVDLKVHDYGYEVCSPGHSYGPAVREYYLFHYIFHGKGVFEAEKETYSLEAGQGFLIYPKELTFYRADKTSPWSYGWIGITGLYAGELLERSGFTRELPIWQGGKDAFLEHCLMNMNSSPVNECVRFSKITGYSYLFFSRMIELASQLQLSELTESRQETYLRSAVGYIEKNYYRKITIEEVSHYVGLDRCYLGTLFKKHLDTTMQDFLINLRVNRACSLLTQGDIRVSDVARSVGYADQLQFSKIFKEKKGISPLGFKNSLK